MISYIICLVENFRVTEKGAQRSRNEKRETNKKKGKTQPAVTQHRLPQSLVPKHQITQGKITFSHIRVLRKIFQNPLLFRSSVSILGGCLAEFFCFQLSHFHFLKIFPIILAFSNLQVPSVIQEVLHEIRFWQMAGARNAVSFR